MFTYEPEPRPETASSGGPGDPVGEHFPDISQRHNSEGL